MVFCGLRAAAAVFLPGQFLGFMDALFHGLDFQVLRRHADYPWSGCCYAAAILFVWASALGAFFSASNQWLRAPSIR